MKKITLIVVLFLSCLIGKGVMAERDQSVRNMEWTEETMKLANVVDSTNTAKQKQLIEQYGFPTWKLVGQYGQMNAWTIAQHSTEYLPYFLKQYRKAVEENNVTRRELAYLEDRLLVEFLETNPYYRYELDSWNGHIKRLIREKSATLTKQDYQEFFAWLFKQVESGDYHLFEYAELYDEVHHRLYKTSYYGQKKFDTKVRIYKPKQLES